MAQAPKLAANPLLKKVVRLADKEDVVSAVVLLDSQGSPTEIAENYSLLVKHLYLPGKNVPQMILFARSGISFALREAKTCKTAGDAKTAAGLQGLAKTMAYNLGANTWPGWKDDGIKITATDIAIGLDAAKTNLRLGIELKRNDFILGNAYWLVGAQSLAAGDHKHAVAAFKKSATKFRAAKKNEFQLMATGYVALTRLVISPGDETAGMSFLTAVSKLQELDSDDAKFFASQLRTAKTVFVKRDRRKLEKRS